MIDIANVYIKQAEKAKEYFESDKNWIISNLGEDRYNFLVNLPMTEDDLEERETYDEDSDTYHIYWTLPEKLEKFYHKQGELAGIEIPYSPTEPDEEYLVKQVDELYTKEFRTAPAYQQFDLYFPQDNDWEESNRYFFKENNWVCLREAEKDLDIPEAVFHSFLWDWYSCIPVYIRPEDWEDLVEKSNEWIKTHDTEGEAEFNPDKQYQQELKDKWDLDDYDRKTVEYILEVKDGYIEFKKPSIKTDFCFGYGYNGMSTSEDLDDAIKAEKEATTQIDYFVEENMKQLEEYKMYASNSELVLVQPNSKVWPHRYSIETKNRWNEQDAVPISLNELDAINQVIRQQQENFKKRIDTYLKKYGLDKLNTWTYLRD